MHWDKWWESLYMVHIDVHPNAPLVFVIWFSVQICTVIVLLMLLHFCWSCFDWLIFPQWIGVPCSFQFIPIIDKAWFRNFLIVTCLKHLVFHIQNRVGLLDNQQNEENAQSMVKYQSNINEAEHFPRDKQYGLFHLKSPKTLEFQSYPSV